MKQIIYQALPRLWGKGHFSDWTGKAFSYLKTLGVDYLWLTGVPRHESGTPFTKGCPGSPYAIIDWYDVNPYLADNEDKRMHEFELLIKRAHLAGIKIMIDYIPNHVGRSYAGDLPCFDHCDGDWTDTRKVNWNDPSTVDKMVDILCFWANKGIDGFRCDMVELVSAEALGEVVRRTRSAFPGLVFVAETYVKENYRRYLSTSSIDILYDKSGSYDILRAISNGNCSATALTSNWQWQAEIQGAMLNFLENHDEQRLASRFWNNGRRYPWAELAFSVLFNEASFMLYYGQEWMDDAAETDNGRTSIYDFTSPSGVRRAAHFARTGKAIKLNDAAETNAYKIALGEYAYKAHISSIKSMTGHMLGAAGAAEAIATVMAIREGIVPPTINLDCPDPECDLDYTPNTAVKSDITIGISDSFGFGGHDGCIAFRKFSE